MYELYINGNENIVAKTLQILQFVFYTYNGK